MVSHLSSLCSVSHPSVPSLLLHAHALPSHQRSFRVNFRSLSGKINDSRCTYPICTNSYVADQASPKLVLFKHVSLKFFSVTKKRRDEKYSHFSHRCRASTGGADGDIRTNADATAPVIVWMQSSQATGIEGENSGSISAPPLDQNQSFEGQESSNVPQWKITILRFLSSQNAVGGVEEKTEGTSKFPVLEGDLRGSGTLYLDKAGAAELDAAVQAMVANNFLEEPAKRSVALGQGTWEVFHAPHLSRLSRPLGVRFDPIRYTLNGTKISSNVLYTVPFLGQGWLSAAGDIVPEGDKNVKILFNEFWWDNGAANLRDDSKGENSFLRELVNIMGRALFFPQFSVFPVIYLDPDFVVFQFTPLQSNIAARRVL